MLSEEDKNKIRQLVSSEVVNFYKRGNTRTEKSWFIDYGISPLEHISFTEEATRVIISAIAPYHLADVPDDLRDIASVEELVLMKQMEKM